MTATRITVATQSDDFATQLRRALGPVDDHSIVVWPSELEGRDIDSIVDDLVEERPDVVVIGAQDHLDTALLVADRFDADHPEISVVLVAQPSASTLERALQAGTRGVLSPTADDDEIRAMIDRALATARRRREQVQGDVASGPTNRVIPVLAAKGGSGKTTVASNLAVSLAQEHPGEVVLIDLDLQFGDVASAFGFEPVNTFADIVDTPQSMTATALKAVLTPRHEDGLYILAAPDTPAQADDLSPEFVREVVRTISGEFPYVVVDTAAGINEFTLEVLDVATDLIILASMDVPSVRAAKKEMVALDMLGLSKLPWHIVLNRSNTKTGISVEDIEATLGRVIDVQIPSNRQIPVSVNRGEPITSTDPRSAPARAFLDLARLTAGEEVVEAEPTWIPWRRAE